jgi:DNA-binding response OmpR family regulator
MIARGTRVLIVEDDRSISRLLQLELEHRGMRVATAFDGHEALAALTDFSPDAIVLDILLPGLDGERVLQEIRRRGSRAPVIMLTARDKKQDKVRNLDAGADDYLTKPFEIEELLARLRAVLRRVQRDETVRSGDLELNLATREVRRGSSLIELTLREFELLEYLARNARSIVPRDLLLENVWRATPEVDPNVVDVYIGYLRKKLDRPGEQSLIRTVRGVGFSLRGE